MRKATLQHRGAEEIAKRLPFERLMEFQKLVLGHDLPDIFVVIDIKLTRHRATKIMKEALTTRSRPLNSGPTMKRVEVI